MLFSRTNLEDFSIKIFIDTTYTFGKKLIFQIKGIKPQGRTLNPIKGIDLEGRGINQ